MRCLQSGPTRSAKLKLLVNPAGNKVRLTEKETAILRYLSGRQEAGGARRAVAVRLQLGCDHAPLKLMLSTRQRVEGCSNPAIW